MSRGTIFSFQCPRALSCQVSYQYGPIIPRTASTIGMYGSNRPFISAMWWLRGSIAIRNLQSVNSTTGPDEIYLLYLYDMDANLPLLRGEPNQLARLINNLVSNAIRYTPKGGVHVRTFRSDDCVCLEVQDTGLGIDADDEPHLYERFYRGKWVRQSNIHGTGLGLAIVKEIVDLHESKIEVNSEVGKGSTFIIRFPVLVNDPWPEKQS